MLAASFVIALGLLPGCAGSGVVAEPLPPRPRATNAPLALRPIRSRAGDGDSYFVGARDVLTVRVFGLEKPRELSTFDVEVDASGVVHVPFAGTIPAGGKTVHGIRDLIAEALGSNYVVNPQVTVTVKEYRSRPISVLGGVEKGGVFYLQKNNVSLIEALSLAGGISVRGGTRAVVMTPGKGDEPASRVDCDLVALLEDGDPSLDVRIEPNSSVSVLPAEDFYVVGYVPKPVNFPFLRPITVTQAVDLAGGVDERFGSPSAIAITRATAQGTRTFDVDLERIAEGEDPDVAILPGDTVHVGRTFAKAVQSLFETALSRFGFGFGYNLN